MNTLIKEHLPYINKIAAKYNQFVDHDDLVQEGILGLIRATETYNPDKGNKFITYASWWIKGYILRYVYKENEFQKHTIEDNSFDSEEPFNLEQFVLFNSFKDTVTDILSEEKVSERDIDIIINRYLNDTPCTLQELGDKYGLTRQRIEQLEKRALRKLQERLGGVDAED